MKLHQGMCFALAVLGLVSNAGAQGFVVDRRPTISVGRNYEIREVAVDAQLRDQVAEVRVSQTFHNPGSTTIDAEYLFPLPEEGAIENLVLMVDGKELPGRLLPKDEARRIYEEIVRTRRDPALLEYMGRGLYRASVFPIPPGADRKITLRYTQLCKRNREIIEFAYPFATQKFTAKPIGNLTLNLEIRSKDSIKSVYCPSDDAEIRRRDDHEVTVRYERKNTLPDKDFHLVYSLSEGALGASVLSYRPDSSDDGYFVVLASPEVKPSDTKPRPKTVVFVLDRSGSMAGKKIEQARKALIGVLNNLRDDDLFNVVVYDDRVESFKPELQRFTAETRAEAERYVANIREGGSTNIDGALKAALGMLTSEERPNYLLFLTDGLPTAGETREIAIAQNARAANKVKARVFAFGLGFDVNARLLDRLSGGNAGVSEYVRPDEDLEKSLGRFSSKLTAPVLANLKVELSGTDLNRTYPRDIPDLFDGGQLVWVGRYRQSGQTKLRLSGKVGAESRSFEFPAELARADGSTSHQFVEKLWAMRRIGDIIDQIDLNGSNRELTDELVALSTKHGILTPYTSFLADERVNIHARFENGSRATESLRMLDAVSGSSGVYQRGVKQAFNQAQNAELPALGESNSIESHARLGGMRGAAMSQRFGVTPGNVAEVSAKPVETVRRLGTKTFYKRNNRWVDAEVKPEEETKATIVEQFTDAFFLLASSQSATNNQYLSFDDEVVVKLDGRVYQVNKAKN